jgi:hypothetical protein
VPDAHAKGSDEDRGQKEWCEVKARIKPGVRFGGRDRVFKVLELQPQRVLLEVALYRTDTRWFDLSDVELIDGMGNPIGR